MDEFKKSCQEINEIMERELSLPPQGEETLRQWGIVGGESYSQLRAIAREYFDHLRDKYR